MPYMHKLSRRLAQNHYPLLAALLLLPACAGEPSSAQYDVSAIRVSPRSVVLTPNAAYQFTAVGDAVDQQNVPVPVLWSAEGGVIDENGRFVAGVADGTYRVRATHATQQWLTDSSTAIVKSAGPPTGLRIQPRDATVAVGQTATLTAYALFDDGDSTELVVSWSAADGSLDTSTGQARYSNDQPGKFPVRATFEALADTVEVTVTVAAVASVSVAPAADTLNVGQGVQLVAVARDSEGNPLTGRQFLWSSGTPGVATVSGTGAVTARAAGTATITVTCEGRSAGATITVFSPPPPAVASVTVSPTSASLAVGGTAQFTAAARDGAGNLLTGRSFTWTSGNPTVATVTIIGSVSGLLAGSATITVTCEGRSAQATVVVTPLPPPSDSLVVIFQDDFETGNLSRTSPDLRWGASNGESGARPLVSSDIARSGSRSLKFTFLGNPDLADDAWSEQRFAFAQPMAEVYLDWYQYFPDGSEGLGARFEYRNADGSDNNKFLLMWDDDYSNDRLAVGFESEWASGGDGSLVTKWEAGSSPFGNKGADIWNPAITNALRGRWVQFRMHVKVASAANNDGVVELWVDGVKRIENLALPMYAPGGLGNYLLNGYLMGWANTGFTQTTYSYVDDFTVSVPVP
jgi:uncharacterized protein YjdB